MADVDLAAIRARHAKWAATVRDALDLADDPEFSSYSNQVSDIADSRADRMARDDVPALLARVDEQDARIAELERQQAAVAERFHVEFHAYGRWHQSVAPHPTFDAAMERVHGSQKRYPERRFRVWRVARSEAVVWSSESAGGETAPESPAEPDPQPTP